MNRPDQPARRKRAKRRHLWWTAVALGLAGCSQTQHGAVRPPDDPLHKVPVAPDPLHPPAPNSQHSQQGPPPIPTTQSATNTASLAADSGLPGSRALAIPEAVPGQLTSNPAPAANPAPPRVVPVPADTGAAGIQRTGSWTPPGSPAPVAATSAAPLVTADNFARLLADRGYTLQHLRQASQAQGVHVICLASFGTNPEQSVFEVTAPTFDDAGQAIMREAAQRAAAEKR